MRKRYPIAAALGLSLIVAVLSSAAFATHGGLHGLFNSRGTVEPFTIGNNAMGFKLKAKRPIDVAVVGAQLDPNGQTGWHMHPADSIVTVQPGSPPLRMISVHNGQCVQHTFTAGQGFVHPAGAHNFVNTSATAPLNFGVAYFVPVGAVLLTNVPAPDECS
jgi:hypothetical protein